MLFPELKGNPGFNVVHGVSMRHQRFISIRLSGPHMTCSMSRLLTTTFTTADFVRSSLRLFEAFSYKTAPKGPPSSFIQHNAQRVFLTQPFPPPALPGFISITGLSVTHNGPACLSRGAS